MAGVGVGEEREREVDVGAGGRKGNSVMGARVCLLVVRSYSLTFSSLSSHAPLFLASLSLASHLKLSLSPH